MDADKGKDLLVDVVIKGFFRDAQFRMVMDDLVGGMPLVQEGLDHRSQGFGLCGGEVDPFPGVHQGFTVFIMGQGRIIIKLIKTAVAIAAAAVAGAGGTVPAGTGEGTVIRTGSPAVSSVGAAGISGTLQGQGTFMLQDTMELDFLPDGRLILSDGAGDGRFGRPVADAGLNNPAFVESKGFIFVLKSQKIPPFRQKCLWRIL